MAFYNLLTSNTVNSKYQNSIIWSYFSFLALAVILPNTAFDITVQHFDLNRPLVNIDYILSIILIISGYRLFGIISLVTFTLIDAFSIILQIMPAIHQPHDLVELLPFLFFAPKLYIVAGASLVVYIIVVAILLIIIAPHTNKKSGFVVFNISLYIYLYLLLFNSDAVPGFKRYITETGFISSQSYNYFDYQHESYLKSVGVWPKKMIAPVEYTGELSSLYRLADTQLPNRLLLIINESWGTNRSDHINRAIIKPLLARKNDLNYLRYGSAVSNISTINAEFRELCSLKTFGANQHLINREEGFADCLPNRLKMIGYNTYAIHGATKIMYHRVHWYPRIGFEKQFFSQNSRWPTKCKSFPGICDLDLGDEVINYFSLPGKRFMYWLTLNTHAPYDLNDLRVDTLDCKSIDIDPDTSTCRNLKLQAQFFFGLSELIDDPRMSGVTVRVIGDHPPPIFNASERKKYFNENEIGWLELSIPDSTAKAKPLRASGDIAKY